MTPATDGLAAGWADIAVGFLGLACVRKSLRGQWMTAAVVVLAIYFAGDGIGRIMQWSAHHNTAPRPDYVSTGPGRRSRAYRQY